MYASSSDGLGDSIEEHILYVSLALHGVLERFRRSTTPEGELHRFFFLLPSLPCKFSYRGEQILNQCEYFVYAIAIVHSKGPL
jgi:hypothetical protein